MMQTTKRRIGTLLLATGVLLPIAFLTVTIYRSRTQQIHLTQHAMLVLLLSDALVLGLGYKLYQADGHEGETRE